MFFENYILFYTTDCKINRLGIQTGCSSFCSIFILQYNFLFGSTSIETETMKTHNVDALPQTRNIIFLVTSLLSMYYNLFVMF